MFLAALALTRLFSFPGGDAHALAAALEEEVHRPVAILVAPGKVYPRFKVEIEPTSTPEKAIKPILHLDSAKGLWGFGSEAWPKGFYFKLQSERDYLSMIRESTNTVCSLEDTMLKRFDTGDGALSLGAISEKLHASLTWHPFYQEARLVVVARNCSVRDVLLAISSAVGATMNDENGYAMKFNASAYRRRTIGMTNLPLTESVAQLRLTEEADMTYLRQLVSALSDDHIQRFLSGWQGFVYYQPDRPVHSAALKRAEAYIAGWTSSDEVRVQSDLPAQIKKIDPSQRVLARLRPDGTIGCAYMTREGTWLMF